jgi:ketosteroid isomerase-like protein
MYADIAEFKDPTLESGIVRQSHQQIIDKYSALSKTFPDVRDRIVQTYLSGDQHVVVEFISTGTGPDGAAFELQICTIFTIVNGKITQDFTYFDNFGEP